MKKKIAIINGVNLNILGKREPDIYGNAAFEPYFEKLKKRYETQADLVYFQHNVEGELVTYLQNIGFEYDAIIFNAGAYTHTSIALRDCIAAIKTPVLEVHISNVHAREAFRHHSYLSAVCVGGIFGLGFKGYDLGIQYFLERE